MRQGGGISFDRTHDVNRGIKYSTAVSCSVPLLYLTPLLLMTPLPLLSLPLLSPLPVLSPLPLLSLPLPSPLSPPTQAQPCSRRHHPTPLLTARDPARV